LFMESHGHRTEQQQQHGHQVGMQTRRHLEAVEGGHCLLEVVEVMCGVPLSMLGTVVLEVVRCVLLCVLEAVEGRFYLPEVLEDVR
jgi:hypothetical protein